MSKATAEHRGLPGLFEADVAFYRDEPFRDYRPQFGIEPEDEQTIWITDHGQRVALIDKNDYLIDLFEFQPGRPRLPNAQKPPVYHAPTLLGARLTLAQWIGVQGRTSDTWELSIEESTDRIKLAISETWQKPARHSVKQLELCVHPQFGYVLFTSDAFRSAEPVAVELYNFLVQGLTHHQPAKRRFPLEVWHSPSRGLLKWTSNMVSLRCAGQHHVVGSGTIVPAVGVCLLCGEQARSVSAVRFTGLLLLCGKPRAERGALRRDRFDGLAAPGVDFHRTAP